MTILIILLLASFAHAETFLFRQKVDPGTKNSIEAFYNSKGKGVVKTQPFYGTYVLPQSDTNYYLIKITPQDDVERLQMLNKFGKSDTDIYQRYEITDRGVIFLEDNSFQFPVDTDYTTKVSSK